MGAFSDEMRRSPLEATSPDGTVRLRLCPDGDIQVDLARGSLADHDEESLGRQVSQAVRVVIAARARAYDQALHVVAGSEQDRLW